MHRHLGFCLAAFGIGLATYPALTAQAPAHRVIRPAKFPYLGLPYSPGILAGDTLYLAGQLGRDSRHQRGLAGVVVADDHDDPGGRRGGEGGRREVGHCSVAIAAPMRARPSLISASLVA